eukprot:1982511-Pyramimonas_sp.AAC.1
MRYLEHYQLRSLNTLSSRKRKDSDGAISNLKSVMLEEYTDELLATLLPFALRVQVRPGCLNRPQVSIASTPTTQLGKVAPPNIEQRFSLLDRAVLTLRNKPGGHKSRTARSSKGSRYSIFGGDTFPNCVILTP